MLIGQLIQISTGQISSVLDLPKESAKRDVELLLAHVLQVNTSYFYTWPDRLVEETDVTAFNILFEARLLGEPIAYILGVQAFWTFDLDVAECTLIPRSDTELLVEIGLELIEKITVPKIIDLGTGTGAVALALASERKDAQVEAVDLIDEAVELARHNAKKLELDIQVTQSSWFDAVQATDFDLIVANPPYIDPTDHHLNEGDLRFEPSTALVSDKNGYADIEIIADKARQHLKQNAWLAFEHGFEQGEKARNILKKHGYDNIETRRDYGGNDRVTLGQYKA